jgi:hypothetical protein
VANYSPLWRVKPVLALGVAAEAAAYLLVVTKVMGNWWLVLATAVIALALPALGRAVRPEAFRTVAVVPGAQDGPTTVGPALESVSVAGGVADARP